MEDGERRGEGKRRDEEERGEGEGREEEGQMREVSREEEERQEQQVACDAMEALSATAVPNQLFF